MGSQTPKTEQNLTIEMKTPRNHRSVQTVIQKTRSCQSRREAGTQMPKNGVYISPETDYFINPSGTYYSSADLFALRLEKAVVIQCHVRGMQARERARRKRDERETREEEERRKIERQQLEAELLHKREIQ